MSTRAEMLEMLKNPNSQHDRKVHFLIELAKAADEAAHRTVLHLVTINGGAAIALLALLGHLATADTKMTGPMLHPVIDALRWFGAGVVAAVLASVGNYSSKMMLARREGKTYTRAGSTYVRPGNWWGFISISLMLALFASLAFFGLGVLVAAHAFPSLILR